MYKIMLMIPRRVNFGVFDDRWPEFLHLAEQMPGLERESTTLIQEDVYGQGLYSRVYEFFFPDKTALLRGLTSPAGEKAGQVIHEITAGQVTILIAEHKEDQLTHIRFSFSSHEEP